MQLKDYQADVLQDLRDYLQSLTDNKGHLGHSFSRYWQSRGVLGQVYKNNVAEVPHVCVKVPTAGGKTFIAVNALACIFTALQEYNPLKTKFVVWLVPSLSILEQTVHSLSAADHPYRQRLHDLFQGRVQIYEKTDVLQGAGFNAESVREQLSVVVMSFDSLKASNKENRKAYQENGYLASFLQGPVAQDVLLPEFDRSALINVIRSLQPVVVVDESHNAESPLSLDMLRNLNPSFIFDLTATPRDNSNIISYVDALRLKKQNMVKLPVIVANQRCTEDVMMAALNMRCQLEAFAKQAEADGGGYIRPIVLFQAEPKNKEDSTTFERVKQTLLALNIPAEQIAIKTASINQLKGVDLQSRSCPVRYIITVNALKEGWDCPFAYVLATLANKSSVVDVTQILGRVLRMPYVRKHRVELLNLSYVFTASSQFQATLAQVVLGLNKAGFSKQDYRDMDCSILPICTNETAPYRPDPQPPLTVQENLPTDALALDTRQLAADWEAQVLTQLAPSITANATPSNRQYAADVEQIKAQAISQAQAFAAQAAQTDAPACPEELKPFMNQQKIKSVFKDSAATIVLPQFFVQLSGAGDFFAANTRWHKLAKENLLSDFFLKNLDATLNFTALEANVYQVDIEEVAAGESAPAFKSVKKAEKEILNQIIKNQPPAGQVRSIVARLFSLLGQKTFYPIDDHDVKQYLARIVEAMSAEQRIDYLARDYAYIKPIKEKIHALADQFAAKQFTERLATQTIKLQPNFHFPASITPSERGPAISKSLYSCEAGMNGLEAKVIGAVAELDNVLWWHRNLDKGKGFCINGAINHYPDFIVLTQRQNMVLLETKGDDRDNSDSKEKLKLGKIWADQANQLANQTGLRYHYLMVFEHNPIDSAYLLSDALHLLAQL